MFNCVWQTIFPLPRQQHWNVHVLLMHECCFTHANYYKDGMTSSVRTWYKNANKCTYACSIMNLTIKLKFCFYRMIVNKQRQTRNTQFRKEETCKFFCEPLICLDFILWIFILYNNIPLRYLNCQKQKRKFYSIFS